MALPEELETLLDHARREARRFAHPVVSPLHVALALAKAEPVRFERAYGDDARKRVEAAVLRIEPRFGPARVDPETEAVFAAVSRARTGDPVGTLIERLEPLVGGLPPYKPLPIRYDPPLKPEPEPAEDEESSPNTSDLDPLDLPYPDLPKVPRSMSRLLAPVGARPGVHGRGDVVREIVSCLSQKHATAPLLVGAPGTGRTAVLTALATFLDSDAYEGPLHGADVFRLRPESVVASERANTLRRIRATALENALLGVDDLEVLCALDANRADPDMLGVVGAMVADPEWRLVLSITSESLSRLEVHAPSLLSELRVIELEPLPIETLEQIAVEHGERLSAYHGVTLPEDVRAAALAPRGAGDQREHPGLLVDRLDRACAHAGLRASRRVEIDDLELPSGEFVQTHLDRETLYHGLLEAVVGQDHVLERICDRLALTKARLDLHPERPDGIFLLVGPTGVGKTLTAEALQRRLHGNDDLIRLDMSEYAEQWALSRLIGPQPGYVGFTEPDAWLTTRIRHNPKAVLLLDEIEKAHPTVWNAFLQVFDAGRLTDSRGTEADFGDVVVAMTSNLGAEAFSREAIGFGEREASIASQSHTVLESVKRAMPPELVNRLDEILVYHPLSRAAIRDIAARNIVDMSERIAERGYRIEIAPDVIDVVAEAGYDPAYGARHLGRNIERLLLEPLASAHAPGAYRAVVDGDRITWEPR